MSGRGLWICGCGRIDEAAYIVDASLHSGEVDMGGKRVWIWMGTACGDCMGRLGRWMG